MVKEGVRRGERDLGGGAQSLQPAVFLYRVVPAGLTFSVATGYLFCSELGQAGSLNGCFFRFITVLI